MADQVFWNKKTLSQMSQEEWESLCDRCGKCCLHKLEDEDSGDVYYTAISCQYLDTKSCQCKDYAHRARLVPGCITLDRDNVSTYAWLPQTCAYRVLAEGGSLPSWHPLVSGDPNTVHSAGVSVREFCVPEEDVHEDDYEDYVVKWVL